MATLFLIPMSEMIRVVYQCYDSNIIELVSMIFEVVVFTFYVRMK